MRLYDATTGAYLKGNNMITLQCTMAYDGFYNDVIASEDEDGEISQKLLQIVVRQGGEYVGSATAGYLAPSHGGHLAVLNIWVEENFRQQGIATKIYDAVEKHYGDTVLPYPGNEGGAIQHFWVNRLKDRPELLARYAENIGRIKPIEEDGADTPRM